MPPIVAPSTPLAGSVQGTVAVVVPICTVTLLTPAPAQVAPSKVHWRVTVAALVHPIETSSEPRARILFTCGLLNGSALGREPETPGSGEAGDDSPGRKFKRQDP